MGGGIGMGNTCKSMADSLKKKKIWSPESKGGPENIISPNAENFGIPEAIEFMKA